MSRRPLLPASLAIALSAAACGGEAHEDAPAVATAAAIAQAAPNATGADVARPPAGASEEPIPIRKKGGAWPGPGPGIGGPLPSTEPMPLPPADDEPAPKGTDL